ncbi:MULTISPECIES: hypothetical protein [Streptomyces]|uniref:Uncharacterized protein n=2 Tax=Streptomyces TaxID=1883 RepID=A0ABV9IRZ6_9ACTN
MNRRLNGRLERLERHLGTTPDLDAETALYGPRRWSVPGYRCYAQDAPNGARLAVVGAAGSVVYEVVGVSLGSLS